MEFTKKMKYKKLTQDQIIISIDRLTRFKPTEDKYLRVFFDIILSNLIDPKIKKSELQNMVYSDIRDLAVEIFNSSFEANSEDFSINKKLCDYEDGVFYINDEVKTLLENRLDYKSATKLIDENTEVLNLKWLKSLSDGKNNSHCLYPVKKVIIAEGITEEILLPAFSKLTGYDFNDNGIKIIGAGGKNQVVKLYYKLKDELRLPIFILLDKDAQENQELINTNIRNRDKIHLLKSGEFEDLLPKSLIIRTVNSEFKNFLSITNTDLDTGESMVKTLEELFKTRGLHEFKKAEFAQRVKQQIISQNDISPELKTIVDEIRSF